MPDWFNIWKVINIIYHLYAFYSQLHIHYYFVFILAFLPPKATVALSGLPEWWFVLFAHSGLLSSSPHVTCMPIAGSWLTHACLPDPWLQPFPTSKPTLLPRLHQFPILPHKPQLAAQFSVSLACLLLCSISQLLGGEPIPPAPSEEPSPDRSGPACGGQGTFRHWLLLV